MKTASRRAKPIQFASMPKTYAGLIALFPLRPLHDKVDLRNATEITDAMAGHDLSTDQDDYFSVLTTLINQYESEHLPQPKRSHNPLGNLKFLLDQHNMTASDLGRLLGQRELGSKMLRGDRGLSKIHIAKLAGYFNVSSSTFL